MSFVVWILVAFTQCASAGEYKIGGFEFDVPGSWQVKASPAALIATRDAVGSRNGALIKMEFCTATELKSCGSDLIEPPASANLDNYFCGKIKPIKTKHATGLEETRKVCSIENADGKSQIGMLHLTHGNRNLGLVLFFTEVDPAPSVFLDAFISSVTLQPHAL